MTKLIENVKKFKRGIESTNPFDRPIGLQAFPKGACSDASFMLGSYLTHLGHGQFFLISGERGSNIDSTWTSHAWLEKDGLIIDITCSQFEEVSDEIIISKTSNWHSRFSIKSTELADVYARDQNAAVALVPFYEKVLKIINSN